MEPDLYAVSAILAVGALTILFGIFGVRIHRSTSDFLRASRSVGPRWNAAAISGEYLSAASFLGIAGLVLKDGADALWYPVGFTAGYLALLLFVAAPLRRSGAYTLPDFAEARLDSVRLRRVCTVMVIAIGWLYLVPQMQGAGLTLSTVTGYPLWVGAAVVSVIVILNVVIGGMRSITFVQAFQYWLKLTALAVPVFVLLIYQAGESAEFRSSLAADAPPFFTTDTTVDIDTDVVLQVNSPMLLDANGEVDGFPADGPVYWAAGQHEASAGAELRFAAGSRVPVVVGSPVNNDSWLQPLSSGEAPLFETYSLVVALLLGTMGLPHVLARFYANPDGRAARATTFVVLALLGLFYLFPTVAGLLARLYVPQLLVNGKTDAAVLLLPGEAMSGLPSQLLGAVVAAGAFAAFLSTASGLVLSIAGVLSTDALPGRVRDFRTATVVAGMVPLAFTLAASQLDLAQSVALAFAVAASSFCPLLVLGIWWRGLTDTGAAAGLIVGGGLSFAAVLPVALGVLAPPWQTLLAQPAAVTVPIAFLTMMIVSRATSERVPGDVARILLRMHAPDRLGMSRDGQVERLAVTAATLPRLKGGRHRR
ncbi:MAG: cation acetate symporter [Pseudonocardiaceae bacterium]|nr:cation acetate symporter [Pseudonocardiaceae bacterium]